MDLVVTLLQYTALSRKLLLQIAPSSLLARALNLLLLKYEFLDILNFCFNRIKSYFSVNTTVEVDLGTLLSHIIELFLATFNP